MINCVVLQRSTNNCLRYFTISIQYLSTNQSNIRLDQQMKLLNNKKEFKKCLDLFDKYNERNPKKFFSPVVTQALKACTQTGDFKRGSSIHNSLVSSGTKIDSHTVSSLIHFYSKFTK